MVCQDTVSPGATDCKAWQADRPDQDWLIVKHQSKDYSNNEQSNASAYCGAGPSHLLIQAIARRHALLDMHVSRFVKDSQEHYVLATATQS
jgi:hypothetical protein